MRFSWTRIGAIPILAFLAVGGAGCSLVNKVRAKDELNASARAYKEGHFDEAEAHAKRALALDPTPTAMIFVARVIHQQYQPGIDKPENIQKAREAIQAYQQVLANNPNNEEAFKAISVLYAAIHDDAKLREWILKRATDSNMSNEKRAEAYAILSGKDWDCSFKITELPDVKVPNPGGAPGFTYKKPKEQKDFDKIQKCVVSGLQEAETAIKFDPNNESAWSYKQNLLLENAKIAFMNGEMDKKATYEKQAEEAGKRAAALFEERRKREEAEAQQTPSPK